MAQTIDVNSFTQMNRERGEGDTIRAVNTGNDKKK